jgi:hypothetical protein
MSKKSKTVITSILVLVILVGGYLVVNSVVNAKNVEKAKTALYTYMAKQGISQSQLKYTSPVKRETMLGGYYLTTSVKGEKPNIIYVYSYRRNTIYFEAYAETPQSVKAGNVGGNRLNGVQLKQLKYPPLNLQP